MRLLSINTSPIRVVQYNGRSFSTGIFKRPVSAPVMLRTLGLDGDEQGDKKVHGGPHMAAYAYTSENYAFWRAELGNAELAYGTFGENLTTEGLDELEVCIGDRFRIGAAAEVEVSIPRAPCSTFAMVMKDPAFPKRFLATGRVGFYLRVVREGMIAPGDPIERTHTDPARLSIAEVTRLKHFEQGNTAGAARALSVAALAPSWRERFQKALDTASASN